MGIFVAEANASSSGSEAASIRRLTTALNRYERMRTPVLLPQLYFERARLRARLGEASEAEDDLRRALAGMDLQRQEIDELEWRVSFSNTVRPAIDALISLRMRTSLAEASVPALTDLARDPAYFVPLTPIERQNLVDTDYRQRIRLGANEAVLSATILPDHLVTWTLREGRAVVVDNALAGDELRRRLERSRNRPTDDDLSWFFDRLIRPVEDQLAGVDHLFLVLDRGLNLLPVGGLYDRETRTRLNERFAVSIVPAALLLTEGDDEAPVSTERVAILGSHTGEGLPRLATVNEEATAISALYPHHRTQIDSVDVASFESMGRWADVLQFSGHAVSNPIIPSQSRLVTETRPIYAIDLRRMDLARSKVVFLSACETAFTTPDDSSGVLSLAVAFLDAGADWVIANLWSIDDEAAQAFSVRFHEELRRDPYPDRALRQTQLHFMRLGSPLEEWAGYQLIHG